MHRWMFLVASSLLLAACATTGVETVAGGRPLTDNVDNVKVVSVNQWAQVHGARIIWINLPQRSRFAEDGTALN
jgi:hypothetical protein